MKKTRAETQAKRERFAELVRSDPELTLRQLATRLGISAGTASVWMAELRGRSAAHYERDSDEQLPAELNRIMRRLPMPAEEAPR